MNVSCSAEPCPIILNSTCVFYEGDALIYTGIVTNDNLQTALQKIDAKFHDAGLGYVFNNGLTQAVPGDPVKLGGTLLQNTTITSGGFLLKVTQNLEAGAHITTGGTSSQFVKGDGSLDGVAWWTAINASTTLSATGVAALTATGTATAASKAVTTIQTRIKRVEYLVTVAATTAVAGFRAGANEYWMGNVAGSGGFHYICRFGPATGVATTTNRCFVGMSTSTAAPTDVQPSTLLQMFGVGWDAADTNIQFMNNAALVTATKTDLGIAVPIVDRTSMYELAMFCAPNSTTITYTFTDLGSGTAVSGTASSNIPAVNTLLSPRGYISAGGTSSVIGLALASLYIETDN